MSLAMRGLPHSEEAERSVLGSLFRDPRVVDDVVDEVVELVEDVVEVVEEEVVEVDEEVEARPVTPS